MKTQNDDWITIKPNGEENKGRHLLVKEGETPKEAIKRTYGVDLDKKKKEKQPEGIKKSETDEQSKGVELIKKLQSKDNLSGRPSTELIEDVARLTGKDMMFARLHPDRVSEKYMLAVLKDKFMPKDEKTFLKYRSDILFSKNQMKREGLTDKEINDISSASESIIKQLENIYNDETLTFEEQTKEFNKIRPQIDALIQKKDEITKIAKDRKEARETKKKEKEEKVKTATKDFEIVQETGKAYKIKRGDTETWIQKRWIKEDGTLTPAGEQSLKAAKERKEAWKRGVRVPERKPDWESEKAIAYDVNLDFYNLEKDKRYRIFIPKSQIREDGTIPSWLIKKKFEEIDDLFADYGGYLIENNPFAEDWKTEADVLDDIAKENEKQNNKAPAPAIRIGNCLICKVKNKFVTIYNDKWITVKPNGEEHKGRHLLLEGGESPREAIERKWKKKPTVAKTGIETSTETATKPTETTKETAAETETPKHYKERYKDFFDKYDAAIAAEKKRYNLWGKVQDLPVGSEKRQKAIEEYYRTVGDTVNPRRQFLSSYIATRSTTIKQDLEKYSSKTDELVKSLDTIEDTPVEKELRGKLDKIKKRKEELYGSKDKGSLGELWVLQTQEVFLKRDLEKETSNAKADQVLKVLNKKDTNFKLKYNTKPSTKEIAAKLDDALSGFIGDGIVPEDAAVDIKRTARERAFESEGSINFNKNTSLPIAIHEYMHFIEEKNPRILANSLAFAKMRTEGEKTQTLAKLTGNRGYKGENAKPDHFFHPYCGKTYSDDGTYENADASEIMSMGLQQIVTNPKKFAEEDREYFDFVIANIKGDI